MKRIILLTIAVVLLLSFAGCDKNLKIERNEFNQNDTSFEIDGFGIVIDEKENVVEIGNYMGDEKKIRVPDTVDGKAVVGILSSCFAGSEAKEIIMGRYVYYIESYAFQWTKIKEFEVPEGATYLGNNVFLECEDLEKVILPDSLETIGENIFEGCAKTVEAVVKEDSLAHNYCKDLLANGVNIKITVK